MFGFAANCSPYLWLKFVGYRYHNGIEYKFQFRICCLFRNRNINIVTKTSSTATLKFRLKIFQFFFCSQHIPILQGLTNRLVPKFSKNSIKKLVKRVRFKVLRISFIRGLIWNAPKSMWKMILSCDDICPLIWNTPKSQFHFRFLFLF